MSIVTVSSKYQIVIPEEIRTKMAIMPKQKLMLVVKGSNVLIVPVEQSAGSKKLARAPPKKGEMEAVAKKITALSKSQL